MPLPTKNTAPPRELAPAGTHSAICIGHYHLGHQSTKFGDKEQIVLSFAIDETREDGKPHVISTTPLTLSFDDRSTLAGYIKSWVGRVVAQDEEFDTASLVDKPCLLTISHGVSAKGNTFAGIDTIASLPKGMPPYRCELDTYDYSPIDPSQPLPEYIPQWIGELIVASTEWKVYHSIGGKPMANGAAVTRQSVVTQPTETATTSLSKPPAELLGYLMALKPHGLKWPYDKLELDDAMEKFVDSGVPDYKQIQEFESKLRSHVDKIPF